MKGKGNGKGVRRHYLVGENVGIGDTISLLEKIRKAKHY